MLTKQGLADEFVKRGWHCPWCINRAIDAVETNWKKQDQYARDLGVQDVRLYDEVSREPLGYKANVGMHSMLAHSGPLFVDDPEVPWYYA